MTTNTKTGWQPLRAVDLRTTGGEPGHCMRCGRNDLRYQHIVSHPIEGTMHVGSECAKRLCFGYSAEREERKLRNLWARRSRWLTRNWATSGRGNATLKFKVDGEAVRVTVFQNRFGWSYVIATRQEPYFSPGTFSSEDAAKLAAFDRIAVAAEW